MSDLDKMTIGDPVEILFVKTVQPIGHDEMLFGVEEWRSATVVAIGERFMTVAFADHQRMDIPAHQIRYVVRKPNRES